MSISTPTSSSLESNIVARIRDRVISLESFKSELIRQGPGRSKEQVLDGLLQYEMFLAQAKAEGLDRDPEILQSFDRLLVARYQEERLGRRLQDLPPPTEEVIRRHYEANLGQFTIPESRRAGVLFIQLNARADPDKQNELRERALSLVDQAQATDQAGFTRLVQQYSEHQSTRYQGGDGGWLGQDAPDNRWEPAVLEAIFNLNNPGQTAPLLQTPQGFYIVRLYEIRPSRVQPLTEVAERLRYQLGRQQQHQAQERFLDELRTVWQPEINHPLLDTIPNPAKMAPSKPAAPSAL